MPANNSAIKFAVFDEQGRSSVTTLSLSYIQRTKNMLESENDLKISSRGEAKMHCIILSYYNQFSHNILDTTNEANVPCTTVRLSIILSNHPMKMSRPGCTCKIM